MPLLPRKASGRGAAIRDNFGTSRPGTLYHPVNAATTLRKRRAMAMSMSEMGPGPQPTADWSSPRRQKNSFTTFDTL